MFVDLAYRILVYAICFYGLWFVCLNYVFVLWICVLVLIFTTVIYSLYSSYTFKSFAQRLSENMRWKCHGCGHTWWSRKSRWVRGKSSPYRCPNCNRRTVDIFRVKHPRKAPLIVVSARAKEVSV